MHGFMIGLTWGWMAIGVITFFYLFKKTAPFGRHTTTGWGPMVDNRLGWMVMEIVSPIVLTMTFHYFANGLAFHQWILLLLWNLHYLNRSIIFPLRIRTNGKQMPVSIMLSAVGFNIVNGFVNGYFLAVSTPASGILFGVGLVVFLSGFIINNIADTQLINLRKPGETGYKIPSGALFNWISCPNLSSEIVEWFGFALMAMNLGALSFAVWTFCNLAPRAVAHHKWYVEKFPDYPKQRRAVIPFLW